MLDPSRPDELMLSSGAVKAYGLHLGSTIRLAFFSDAQTASPTYAGYPTDKPRLLITLKLVGIVEDDVQVVQSDDEALGDQFGVLSPVLVRRMEGCCAYYTYASLKLDGSLRHAGAVESEISRIVSNVQSIGGYQTAAPTVATAERAIRPEAIAFGVFGGVAALAALVIAAQVLSRLIRRDTADRAVLPRARRRPRHGGGRRPWWCRPQRGGRNRAGHGGRGRAVPACPDRPGSIGVPRQRRRSRLDRPRPRCSGAGGRTGWVRGRRSRTGRPHIASHGAARPWRPGTPG